MAFAAGKAVLEHWNEDFEDAIATRSLMIQSRLKRTLEKYPQKGLSYRGLGMVWGLDVGSGKVARLIINEAFNQGLLVESSGADDEVLKIMAALTIDIDTLEQGLIIFEKAVHHILDNASYEACTKVSCWVKGNESE